MASLAGYLVRRGRAVLALTALITGAALAVLPRLSFDLDVTSFLTESTAEGRVFAALQARYDVEEPITVLLERSGGGAFDTREGMVAVAAAREAFAAREGVDRVGAFLPDTFPVVGGEVTAEALSALPGPLLAPLRSGPGAELLLGPEGRSTLMLVQPRGDPVAAARAVMATPLPEGLEATFAGNPVVYAQVLDVLSSFLLAIPPLVLGLLLLVFTLSLGGPRAALLAVVPAVLGSLWTFGLLAAVGVEVDIVTVILPVFVIVMGSADGLHFVSHYQGASARGLDATERVASTLRQVGVPMILTTLSTAAGFLSLLGTGVPPLQQLGGFVALGIGLAGVISYLSLPALMARLQVRASGRSLGRGLLRPLAYLAARRWAAATLAAPLLAFAAVFVPRLEVDTDPLFFFPEDHAVRDAFERVEAAFGGATPLFGEFVLDRGEPLEPQLAAIRDRSRALEALPGARRVLSIADVVDDVPAAQAEALLSGERTPPFGSMVREDGLRFVFFPGSFDATDVRAWQRVAEDAPEVRLLTGTPILFERLSDAVARAQAVSVVLAFALVALLLAVTYRSLPRALVALAPLLLTVGVVLGFVAAAGIGLNLITAIASSIVIGVAIDYAIHLVAAIDHARRDAPEQPGWVLRGLRAAGRPILANALGVAVGLTALQLSPLRPHHQISAILWVAMVVGALTTLVLIPAFAPRRGVREGAVGDAPTAPGR